MTDLYAVMGNPIAHSKSPMIHTHFAKSSRQDLIYSAILVPQGEGTFAAAANDFFQRGGKGLNVTVPFKEDAWRYADQFTPRAQRAQAVNTLMKMDDGKVLADNTDGVGLVKDIIENQNISIQGKRVLILGAGGAVRGVLQPILEKQPEALVIANRTVSKAEKLARDFANLGNIVAKGFNAIDSEFDLIINGTSASLQGDVPPVPTSVIGDHTVGYDMMYSYEPTAFNQWMLQHGAEHVCDGLGMLVEQAAAAFLLWRGVAPVTDSILRGLREFK